MKKKQQSMTRAELANCFDIDLQEYSVVSFDVFDTAVLRHVAQPRDVHLLVERELVETHRLSRHRGFAKKRDEAELNLVKKTWSKDRSLEVCLADIYEYLFLLHPELQTSDVEIAQLELAAESAVCFANTRVKEIYDRAIASNKQVIFVSDTYLPEEHMRTMLADCGYGHWDGLFVSNEVGTNKASGKLFEHVLNHIDSPADQILHIGDAFHSDVTQPLSHGLSARHIPKAASLLPPQRLRGVENESDIDASLFRGALQNQLLTKANDSAFDVGYQVLGPLCMGFAKWVYEHATSKGITDLYFVAREGWFLKKTFDMFTHSRTPSINSHYLLASRRALLFPHISDDGAPDKFRFLMSNKSLPLAKYLDTLELSISQDVLEQAGFTSTDDVLNPGRNADDKRRLLDLLDRAAPEVLRNAREEKSLYCEYLDGMGILDLDRVGLVDSGWFGNGQNCIERMVRESNGNAQLHGFYFALHKRAQAKFTSTSRGYGYLYHFEDLNGDIEEFLELARIIEVLLSAPSESLKRFRKDDAGLQPVFLTNNVAEALDPIVAEIQSGAEAFISGIGDRQETLRFVPPNDLTRHLLMDFIRRPSANEARQVGSIPYERKILSADVQDMFANPRQSFVDVLLSPRKFVNEFSNSNWRAAYAANLDSRVAKWFLQCTSRYYLSKRPLYTKVRRVKQALHRRLKKS